MIRTFELLIIFCRPKPWLWSTTADRLAPTGLNLGRSNTQGLKITEENMLPCNDTYEWLDVQVFSDKEL